MYAYTYRMFLSNLLFPPPLSLSLSEHMDAFVSLVEEEHKAVIPHYIKVM